MWGWMWGWWWGRMRAGWRAGRWAWWVGRKAGRWAWWVGRKAGRWAWRRPESHKRRIYSSTLYRSYSLHIQPQQSSDRSIAGHPNMALPSHIRIAANTRCRFPR
ncbi:hypothetical protein B484DRAFT_443763 [Ochromonadaceae sp. CCMP2298]|nr:hypothetical protein B484DRAFT_443763 [Ochromonadaceae sp. CCMP2298]